MSGLLGVSSAGCSTIPAWNLSSFPLTSRDLAHPFRTLLTIWSETPTRERDSKTPGSSAGATRPEWVAPPLYPGGKNDRARYCPALFGACPDGRRDCSWNRRRILVRLSREQPHYRQEEREVASKASRECDGIFARPLLGALEPARVDVGMSPQDQRLTHFVQLRSCAVTGQSHRALKAPLPVRSTCLAYEPAVHRSGREFG